MTPLGQSVDRPTGVFARAWRDGYNSWRAVAPLIALSLGLCAAHASDAASVAAVSADVVSVDATSANSTAFDASDGGTVFGEAIDASAGPASTKRWIVQATPYLWAANLHGRISPFRRGPTIHADKSFSEVLDHLRFGGFIDLWGRYDRYLLSADVAYVDTAEGHASGLLPGIGPVPPGTQVKGEVKSKLFIATLLGGYRVLDTPDFTLDAMAGVRFWHVSNQVKVSALGTSRRYGENFGWAEPVIGARAFVRMTDAWSLQAQANVGGFGVGSDASWSALATVNYDINGRFSVAAGYKVLDVNYDHGGHVYDARLNGPVLGLTYRF